MKYFKTESHSVKQEVEYYVFDKTDDIPPTFHEFRHDGGLFYGSLEPSNEKFTYKIGHYYNRNFKIMLEYLNERAPNLRESLIHVVP
mmetsp:Transcript_16734/g.14655  ORF Transcript_16734/g.14655 Transcript_16734/m.14655 type:complete len:87 (+) Transcript_16734:616-876(+)